VFEDALHRFFTQAFILRYLTDALVANTLIDITLIPLGVTDIGSFPFDSLNKRLFAWLAFEPPCPIDQVALSFRNGEVADQLGFAFIMYLIADLPTIGTARNRQGRCNF
jgi:hypothetical protein